MAVRKWNPIPRSWATDERVLSLSAGASKTLLHIVVAMDALGRLPFGEVAWKMATGCDKRHVPALISAQLVITYSVGDVAVLALVGHDAMLTKAQLNKRGASTLPATPSSTDSGDDTTATSRASLARSRNHTRPDQTIPDQTTPDGAGGGACVEVALIDTFDPDDRDAVQTWCQAIASRRGVGAHWLDVLELEVSILRRAVDHDDGVTLLYEHARDIKEARANAHGRAPIGWLRSRLEHLDDVEAVRASHEEGGASEPHLTPATWAATEGAS